MLKKGSSTQNKEKVLPKKFIILKERINRKRSSLNGTKLKFNLIYKTEEIQLLINI
jgi:hypothetical protein